MAKRSNLPASSGKLGAILALLCVAVWAVGCSDRARPPGSTGKVDEEECIDEDEDGFGEGCGELDCDDGDKDVTDQCRSCTTPKPGCPCDEANVTAPCGVVHTEIDGQVVCGKGRMVCDVDTWGECIISNAVMMKKAKATQYELVDPTSCSSNPCDPYCHEWPDTTDGLDPGDGTTVKDDSITLTDPEIVGSGLTASQCHGGATGNCAHHVCEQGAALTAGCDVVGVSSACIAKDQACPGVNPCCYGLTCIDGHCEEVSPGLGNIFYAPFYNATGWTMTGEWEIGAAQVSSGHTYGNADPGTDATSGTTDNWLAGVDIGGNVNISYSAGGSAASAPEASPGDPHQTDGVTCTPLAPKVVPAVGSYLTTLKRGVVSSQVSGAGPALSTLGPAATPEGKRPEVKRPEGGAGKRPKGKRLEVATRPLEAVSASHISLAARPSEATLHAKALLGESVQAPEAESVKLSDARTVALQKTAPGKDNSNLYVTYNCSGVPVWTAWQPEGSYDYVTKVVSGVNRLYRCDYSTANYLYCPWPDYAPGTYYWDYVWNYYGDCQTGDTTAPTTPTGLSIVSVTSTTIQWSWNASTDNVGVTKYKAYRSSTYLGETTGLTYTATGLSPATGYTLKVAALDAALNASSQASITGTTAAAVDTTAPTTPTSLGLGTITTTSIRLNWTASTDAVGVTGYEMYRGATLVTTISPATTYDFTGLTPSTAYTLGVKARDAAGNVSGLATKPATTLTPDTTAPTTPTGLGIGTTTGTSIVVTWTASTDAVGVTGYQVYKDGVLVTTVTGTSYTFTGLTSTTTYTFGVKAYDAAANYSGLATINGTTLDTVVPTAPSDVGLDSLSGTTAHVTWTASTDNVGVVGYKLYNGATLVGTTAATDYTFLGLTVGSTNTLGVKAYDAAGNESTLSTIAVTTIDTSPPSNPSNLTVSAITTTSFTLSWTASTDDAGAGVVGYDVYNGATLLTSIATTSYNFTGLTINTTYTLGVQAYDAAGNKSTLVTKAGTTASCVPACSGKQCGSDGCGGSCGSCPSGESCTTEQLCVDQDLVAWWPFDEASGQTLHPDAVGTCDATGSSTSMWTSGKIGTGALTFNGTSYGTTLPYNADAGALGPVLDGASAVSISLWMQRAGHKSGCPSSDVTCRQVMFWSNALDSADAFQLRINGDISNPYIQCGLSAAEARTYQYRNTASYLGTMNSWYHIVCTVDLVNNQFTIYINGSSVSLNTSDPAVSFGQSTLSNTSTNMSSSYPDRLGNARTVDGYRYHYGKLDQVKLFTKELTSTEVTALYNEADTTAPPNITTTSLGTITSTSIVFNWTAVTDTGGSGTRGYQLYRDGTLITTVFSGTTYTFTGLQPLTTYTFGIKALDKAGNVSSTLATRNGTTITCVASCSGKECGSDGCGGTCGTCSGTNTCNASQICVDPNLAAWWKFDESSGTTLTDSIGTNHGTMQSTNPTRVTGLIGGASGYGALSFGGNGQINLLTDTAGELATALSGASGMAISAWMKRTGPKSGCSGTNCRQQVLYSFATSSSGGFTMRVNEDNKLACGFVSTETGTIQWVTSTSSMSSLGWDGTWIHAVCNIDIAGDKLYLYKNGSLHSSANVSFTNTTFVPTSSTSPSSDSIGGGDSRYFYGRLDHIKVFKKKLTGAEITSLYQDQADTTAPTNPSGLTVGTPTLTTLPLTWTASTDTVSLFGYELYLNGTLVGTSTGTSYTFTGLTQGTTYTLGVKAKDSAGNLSGLVTVNGTTTTPDLTAPTAPSGLSVSNITSTSIRLNWAASTDAVGVTGYKLFKNATHVTTISPAPSPSAATNYTFNDLTVNTTYTLGVQATDAAGNVSTLSTLNGTTVDTTPPVAPAGYAPGVITATSIEVIWNFTTDNVGVVNYKLYKNGTFVGTSTGPNFTFTGLTQGTTYTFGLSAIDAAGNESTITTDVNSTMDTTAPTVPTGLVVSNQTVTSLKLSWNASTDNVSVAGYNLFLNGVQIASTSSLNYTFSGLAGATTYTLGVKAYDNTSLESGLASTTGTTTSGPGTFYWLTSPVIDTADITGPMSVEYKRYTSTLDTAWMTLKVQIKNNAGNWVDIWQWAGYSWADSSWQTRSFDITAYKHAGMQLRWGYAVNDTSGMATVSGWSLDEVKIIGNLPGIPCAGNGNSCSASMSSCCSAPNCTGGVCVAPMETSCVSLVCAEIPSCCSGVWNAPCVVKYKQVCSVDCAINESEECVMCYKDGIDHDLDGWTYPTDCLECDATTNPGAYDFLNNKDDNCNGAIDDEVTDCDLALSAISPTDAKDYAKAMDLCRFTSASATGASKNWGVTAASLVRANDTAWTSSTQRGIKSRFGTNNLPRKGNKLAVFSSGAARDQDDSSYVNPNGEGFQQTSYDKVTPPSGFPKNKAGCPVGTAAYDSMGLNLDIRAPTNAQSFAYNFIFFTAEYPEWVCTNYNDTFIARYTGSLNPFADKNISFDSSGNPVTVNIGFFTIPGGPYVYNHSQLLKTGLSSSCSNPSSSELPGTSVCGGSTSWLKTTAPVVGGENIKLALTIWDTGDKKWDSSVVLDNFTWSQTTATIETLPDPEPPPNTYEPASFIRDYDAGGACAEGDDPIWGLWSWETSTPGDSQIQFYVRVSNTLGGLASATEVPLKFTVPSSVAGQNAIAKTSPVNTIVGSAPVFNTLSAAGLDASSRYLRVRSHFVPSGDGLQAPSMSGWNMQLSCQPNQ